MKITGKAMFGTAKRMKASGIANMSVGMARFGKKTWSKVK
jgi:hypothetical protein